MKNIAMRILYDGTRYHGWQRQANAQTVQQTLEEALSGLTGERIQITGCSRTDAGVHALDYVFNFRTDTGIPVDRLPYALNYRLARDISATEAWEVPADFNARFSARGKRYIYRIWNARTRNPFLERYSWHIPYRLEPERMIQAAPVLEGTHDFSGFMAAGGDQTTTVRTVRLCRVEQDGENPGLLTVTVEADAFLYNMVRIITGTLAEIGLEKIPPEALPDILASRDRRQCGRTAPAQGLFLKKVYYDIG